VRGKLRQLSKEFTEVAQARPAALDEDGTDFGLIHFEGEGKVQRRTQVSVRIGYALVSQISQHH